MVNGALFLCGLLFLIREPEPFSSEANRSLLPC